MKEICTDNVRREFVKLVPSSFVNDITCFVFYDHHPRGAKRIDVTVCTSDGEIKEFFQRDLLSSLSLSKSTPTEISILRNRECELFYVVVTDDELFIVSSRESLQIHRKISNVEKYCIEDTNCNGQICLKITLKDDAVPLIFDANFKLIGEELTREAPSIDSLPVMVDLKRKYIEAQYCVKLNEQYFEERRKIRQQVTLSTYQKLHPDLCSSAIDEDSNNISAAVNVKTHRPWVKVCNGKIVIVLKAQNNYKESLEDVHILLKSARPSLGYTTKLFEPINTSPFWREKQNQKMLPNCETAVVAVMSLDEIKLSILSRIEFNGALYYKSLGNEYLMPFDDVIISSMETLGDEFDVLSAECDSNTMLAILSSSVKTDLCMRHIKTDDAPDISLQELFSKHLNMTTLAPNVIVYNKSPYHALNGVMVHFHTYTDSTVTVSVFSRSKPQVLALIHCINDAVPSKIIITTPNYKITAKSKEFNRYTEDIPEIAQKHYKEHASTILKRTGMIMEYLDDCMVKMNESKIKTVRDSIGSRIDLYAIGETSFMEFKNKLYEEGKRAAYCLMNKECVCDDVEQMIID